MVRVRNKLNPEADMDDDEDDYIPKKKPFKCKICNKKFSGNYSLSAHTATHSDATPFHCPLCPYQTKTKKYLARHHRQIHADRPKNHKCTVCGKEFLHACDLKEHNMIHTGEKPYNCNVCGKTFRVSYSLNTHMLIHKDEKPFQCSFCDYACRDSSTLRKHQNKHMGIEPVFQCKICSKGYKNKRSLKMHIAEHLDVDMKKFPCDRCDKMFKTKCQRTTHFKMVHARAMACTCPVCGARLASKYNLSTHMRRHLEERPFTCTHPGCELSFKDKGCLQKHSRIHDPSKHIPCKYCGRKFVRRAHVKRHEVVMHLERKKTVECDYCGAKFYTKNYLLKHIKMKHVFKQKFKYICDICGLVTHNKPSIVAHLKNHQNDNDVQCRICDNGVVYKKHTYLKLHYWKTHSVRYKITRNYNRPSKEAKAPLVEVKVEPIEAESYEGIDLMEVQKKEDVDDDEESLDYSKRVLSEDITALVMQNKVETREVDFDDFYIKHIIAKQEQNPVSEKTTDRASGVNEEQNESVKRKIKQILARTQKLEAAKELRRKRKEEEALRKQKEEEEARVLVERERREIAELRRVRELYNERMRLAVEREKGSKEQVKIKYFKRKPDDCKPEAISKHNDDNDEQKKNIADDDVNTALDDERATTSNSVTENIDDSTENTESNDLHNTKADVNEELDKNNTGFKKSVIDEEMEVIEGNALQSTEADTAKNDEQIHNKDIDNRPKTGGDGVNTSLDSETANKFTSVAENSDVSNDNVESNNLHKNKADINKELDENNTGFKKSVVDEEMEVIEGNALQSPEADTAKNYEQIDNKDIGKDKTGDDGVNTTLDSERANKFTSVAENSDVSNDNGDSYDLHNTKADINEELDKNNTGLKKSVIDEEMEVIEGNALQSTEADTAKNDEQIHNKDIDKDKTDDDAVNTSLDSETAITFTSVAENSDIFNYNGETNDLLNKRDINEELCKNNTEFNTSVINNEIDVIKGKTNENELLTKDDLMGQLNTCLQNDNDDPIGNKLSDDKEENVDDGKHTKQDYGNTNHGDRINTDEGKHSEQNDDDNQEQTYENNDINYCKQTIAIKEKVDEASTSQDVIEAKEVTGNEMSETVTSEDRYDDVKSKRNELDTDKILIHNDDTAARNDTQSNNDSQSGNDSQANNDSQPNDSDSDSDFDKPLLKRKVTRNTNDKGSDYEIESDDVKKPSKRKKMEFKTHQCYVCFKLYQTKEELINHCQEHFDVCNDKTLAKCPICNHVSTKIAWHLKRKHKVNIKVPFNKIKDKKTTDGSRYVYEVEGTEIEVIPSIKILNKTASNEIDKKRREKNDKSIAKSKLVRKGDTWIVEKEFIDLKYDEMPELTDMELSKCKVTDTDIDRLGQLSHIAKKKGLKMMFPCFVCDKVCQNFSALKLHKRRHEDNPKPFAPRVKNGARSVKKDIKVKLNKSNRTAFPKPIKNKHKCDAKLKEFFESNIRGGDIEFWQFLKIFNKMDREKVNDFKDLEARSDFGNHLDYYKDVADEKGNGEIPEEVSTCSQVDGTGDDQIEIPDDVDDSDDDEDYEMDGEDLSDDE